MNEFSFLWSNTHQLFYMYGNINAYRRYPEIPFNNTKNEFQVAYGSKMTAYESTADLADQVEKGAQFLDRAWAQQYLRDAYVQIQAHHALGKELEGANFSTYSDAELLDAWQRLVDDYGHSAAYFRSTQEEPSRAIIASLAEEVSIDELQTLLVSPELDAINKEEIAWEEVMRAGFTRDKALLHLKAFPWLFQNSSTYDETVDELEQRATGHVSRDITKEKDELRHKQAKLLAQYPQIKDRVATVQELALLRPAVKECWASSGYYALPILTEVSKRSGVDFDTLNWWYLSEDIETLIKNGTVLTDAEVAMRKRCTVYWWHDGILEHVVGEDAEVLAQKVIGEASPEDVRELKGMPARPGKVTGVIHILTINDPVATKKFRESFTGGVLVTSMTQPNVVDIARRASAIVTDEGGMLCHAAIISREFGIPCIVGTHRATSVLKDGDLVEVDADKGIVRVVEQHE